MRDHDVEGDPTVAKQWEKVVKLSGGEFNALDLTRRHRMWGNTLAAIHVATDAVSVLDVPAFDFT